MTSQAKRLAPPPVSVTKVGGEGRAGRVIQIKGTRK